MKLAHIKKLRKNLKNIQSLEKNLVYMKILIFSIRIIINNTLFKYSINVRRNDHFLLFLCNVTYIIFFNNNPRIISLVSIEMY
ncbi:hypothetical protein GCM10019994_35040 [Enterococcus raffinosus]